MKNCVYILLLLLCASNGMAEQKLPDFHHRSDILMPESLLKPDNLLFETGNNGQAKVVCKTCHGIEDIQDKDFSTLDKNSEDFFAEGPYEDLTELCYLCHKKAKNEADNIHVLLDDNLDPIEHKCLYCHLETLEPEDVDTRQEAQPKDLKLRLPIDKICYGCHLEAPHLNALEHSIEMDKDMFSYWQKQNAHDAIRMPLGEHQKILCVTCHDPHQQGVLKINGHIQANSSNSMVKVSSDLKRGVQYISHPWASIYALDKQLRLYKLATDGRAKKKAKSLSLRYQRIDNEVLLRLPAKNGALCMRCHDFSNERQW